MAVTYPKSGLQDFVAFQANGKPGTYPVQAWNDEIGTFQFLSSLVPGTTIKAGLGVVMPVGGDGVRLPNDSDILVVGQPVAAKAATGTLQFSANPSADDTVTIGATTYKFVAAVAAANDVAIGANVVATMGNLIAAVAAGEGSGTAYGAGTVANASATAEVSTDDVTIVTAKAAGTAGNAIALTTTSDVITPSGATLTGGADAGAGAAVNANFVGVVVFSYYMTAQTDGYSYTAMDVNLPVKQKGYVTVCMSNLDGAEFGKEVTFDSTKPGYFKVSTVATDPIVGKINKVFPDYGTCEILLKEFK